MAQSKLTPICVIACAALLGACSSSGSGSSSNHHTSVSHHSSSTSATKPQATVKITGNYLYLPYDDKEIQAKFKTGDIDVSGELETLRIGNQVIPLYPNNQGRFVELQGDNVKVLIAKHLTNARYGWVARAEGLSRDSTYFFAQGKPSPALSAGKFSYTGHSVFSHQDLDGKMLTGTSRFDVDFGSKKLTGTISAGQYSVPIFANIQSNGNFAGEKNGVISKGAFYGKDAAELAGTFYQNKNSKLGDFIGAFGAGNKTAK